MNPREATTAFARRWDPLRSRLATLVLSNVLGIPLWAVGVVLAVRHPIYAGALLECAGMVPVQPLRTVALATATAFVWAYVQARLEEEDLLQRMPAYREYMKRVPRFVPGLTSRVRP
jgi:protein-S-isoprenylcysteine O-methyltransferase Ste14